MPGVKLEVAGNVKASGSLTATSFTGSGSALTNLNASNLASGTVPSSVISGTYSNAVTFNNAGNSFSGNGSGLTSVAAATATTATNALSLGGVAAANYARTDTANTFNGNQTILGGNLAVPADGLVAGSNQLVLSGGTIVGVGSSGSYWISGRPTLYIAGPTTPNLTIDQTGNGIARWTIFTYATNGDLLISNSTGGTGSERFHITTAGNVGIDTTAPATKLHVYGSSPEAVVDGSADPGIEIRSSGGIPYLGFAVGATSLSNPDFSSRIERSPGTGGNFEFTQTGSGNFTFTGANVGTDTGAPAVKLQVVGDIRVGTSGTNGYVQNFGGTAIAGTCSSDARLKVNIQSFPPVLDRLAQLQPVTFNWRAAEYPEYHFGSARSFGLIAQQVEKIFPELVTEDARGFKQGNYSELPYIDSGEPAGACELELERHR